MEAWTGLDKGSEASKHMGDILPWLKFDDFWLVKDEISHLDTFMTSRSGVISVQISPSKNMFFHST